MKCCTWQPVVDAFNWENTFKWMSFSSLVPFRFLWGWNSRGKGAVRLFLTTGVSSPCYLVIHTHMHTHTHTHSLVSMTSLSELLWAGEPPGRWLVTIILYSSWQLCVLADLHCFHTFLSPSLDPRLWDPWSHRPSQNPWTLPLSTTLAQAPPSIPQSPSHCWWSSRHVDPHTQSFSFLTSSPPGLCSHLLEPHHGYDQRLCPWDPCSCPSAPTPHLPGSCSRPPAPTIWAPSNTSHPFRMLPPVPIPTLCTTPHVSFLSWPGFCVPPAPSFIT